MTRPLGYMSWDVLERIIEEASGRTKDVWAHVFGEPLVYPLAAEALARFKEAGFWVGLSTNGMLLNREMAEKIMEAGPDCLIISVDSLNRETYEKIRMGASLDRLLENIDAVLEARLRAGTTEIVLQVIDFGSAEREMEEVERRFGEKLAGNGRIQLKPFCTYGGEVSSSAEIFPPGNGRCTLLNYSLTILWDGTVTICCHDYNGWFKVGHLEYETLEEIWASPLHEAYRKAVESWRFGNMDMCRRCLNP
jgi:radical SAM protein with 4Fe4S-binding SPASM domain